MKTAISPALLGLLSMATFLTEAHYTFDQLVVGGALKGTANTYIRHHTRNYMPTKFDQILANDFRCNQAATIASSVYTVRPGDKVALKQAYGGTGMSHPGPTQVYMSKAPSSVKSYDGSGEWFKVHQSLVCRAGAASKFRTDAWCMYGEDRIEFTIPATVPNGEYLVRVEHIALHGAHIGEAEFYYACAQVKVEGSSASSVPGTKTRIPGVYAVKDAAVNFSVWGTSTSYPYTPGIPVAPGGTIRGSANGASGFTITTVGG